MRKFQKYHYSRVEYISAATDIYLIPSESDMLFTYQNVSLIISLGRQYFLAGLEIIASRTFIYD